MNAMIVYCVIHKIIRKMLCIKIIGAQCSVADILEVSGQGITPKSDYV